MPESTVKRTGSKLPIGVFVDIYGIDCKYTFKIYSKFTTFFNYSIKVNGRNDIKVYLVDLIILEG